jgi:hypothetical protein
MDHGGGLPLFEVPNAEPPQVHFSEARTAHGPPWPLQMREGDDQLAHDDGAVPRRYRELRGRSEAMPPTTTTRRTPDRESSNGGCLY